MRRSQIFCAIVGTLIAGPESIAVQAAPRQRPCAEIRAACEQAGFVQGGSQTGDALCGLHCVHLKGTPPTTQGHQAFARDRFAACCSLQSAESKFRPAERFPGAHGRFC